jgi:hypothetical protein
MRHHAAAALIALGLVASAPTHAQDRPIVGVGVFCETADQVGKFIRAATEVNIGEAFKASRAPTPFCAIAPVAYYEREQVGSLREGLKSFRILRATVVSVLKDNVWVVTKPSDLYMAVLEKGDAV